MTDKTASDELEVVAECLFSIKRGYHQMEKPGRLGIDDSDKAAGFSVVQLVSLTSAQAAVATAKLRILRGQFTQMCSHCGWEAPAGGGSWADLQLHTKACIRHPLFLMTAERDEQAQRITALETALVVARRELEKWQNNSGAKPGYKYVDEAIALIDTALVEKT